MHFLYPFDDAGIDRVILNPNFGASQAETLEGLQCFAEEVMPHFSSAAPSRLASAIEPAIEAAE